MAVQTEGGGMPVEDAAALIGRWVRVWSPRTGRAVFMLAAASIDRRTLIGFPVVDPAGPTRMPAIEPRVYTLPMLEGDGCTAFAEDLLPQRWGVIYQDPLLGPRWAIDYTDEAEGPMLATDPAGVAWVLDKMTRNGYQAGLAGWAPGCGW